MTPRLCGAEYVRDYKILATFEDGKTGVIDLGSWVDRVLNRYGPVLASRPVVDVRPGSMNAARRLTARAARPGASGR